MAGGPGVGWAQACACTRAYVAPGLCVRMHMGMVLGQGEEHGRLCEVRVKCSVALSMGTVCWDGVKRGPQGHTAQFTFSQKTVGALSRRRMWLGPCFI